MIIALDYDDTFSADPELWLAFITLAQSRGHEVVCVTKREPELGTPGLTIPTIYTSRKNKLSAVAKAGKHISVWIDDTPSGILFDDGARVQVIQ